MLDVIAKMENIKQVLWRLHVIKLWNHMMKKQILKIKSFVPIFNEMNGYFEEINRNKYLTLVPTNESKEKNTKIWRTVD